MEYHRVEVKIVGQAAATTVDQSFFNPNPQRLEGTYLFPIPKGATIDSFQMDVNGTMIEAELLDAEKARAIYEDIVRRMRDPALLEYTGQGLYKVRIFPLEPNASKRVRMQYTELLGRDSGLVEYRYPLNTEKFSSAPIEEVSIRVEVESGGGMRTVYSPSHPVEVEPHGRRPGGGGVGGRGRHPGHRLPAVLRPGDEGRRRRRPAPLPGRRRRRLLPAARCRPPTQLPSERITAKDVVFVLDTSGSMAERGKIDQAKRALELCLANLNPHDRFEVVRFSTEAEALMGGLVEATAANRRRAERAGGRAPADRRHRHRGRPGAGHRACRSAGRARAALRGGVSHRRSADGGRDRRGGAARRGPHGGRRPRASASSASASAATSTPSSSTASPRRPGPCASYVLPEEDLELKVSSFFAKISHPVLANPQARGLGRRSA